MAVPLTLTIGYGEGRSSRGVIAWTTEWARGRAARIRLMTTASGQLSPHAREAVDEVRAQLQSALPDADVQIELREEDPVDAVVLAAQDVDLLVLAAPTGQGLRLLVHEAQALDVAAHVVTPVVLVSPEWAPTHGGLVVGLGDDDSSETALRFAAETALAMGETLTIAHAWPPGDDPGADRQRHREYLARTGRILRARFPELNTAEELHQGDADEMLRVVGEDAFLLVLGTHRRGLLPGLIHGSTTRALIDTCAAPLCVVPPREVAESPVILTHVPGGADDLDEL
ncbi:MAG: universal stress protein [Protaetiibacter sp.]